MHCVPQLWVVVGAVRQPGPTQTQKGVTKAGDVTGTSHFIGHSTGQLGQYKKGANMTTSEPFEFAKYRRPQFEGPLRRARAAESDDDQMPAENLLNQPNLRRRRKDRPLCGAKTRAGGTCMVRVEFAKTRCRFHGGLSTGPKTEAGRARIAEAQRRRWRAYREGRQETGAS
jgi:hypothetical protein